MSKKEIYRNGEEMAYKAIQKYFPIKRCNKTWVTLYTIYREGMKMGEMLCLALSKMKYVHEIGSDKEVISLIRKEFYMSFAIIMGNKIRELPKSYTTRYMKALAIFCWDSIGAGVEYTIELFLAQSGKEKETI